MEICIKFQIKPPPKGVIGPWYETKIGGVKISSKKPRERIDNLLDVVNHTPKPTPENILNNNGYINSQGYFVDRYDNVYKMLGYAGDYFASQGHEVVYDKNGTAYTRINGKDYYAPSYSKNTTLSDNITSTVVDLSSGFISGYDDAVAMGLGQASGKMILDEELPDSNTDAYLYTKLLGNSVGGAQGLYEFVEGAGNVGIGVVGAPETAGLSLGIAGYGVIQAGHGVFVIKNSVNEIEKNANRLFAKRRKSSSSNNSEVEQKELTRAKEFENSLVNMGVYERIARIKEELHRVATKEYGWVKYKPDAAGRPVYRDKEGNFYSVDTQHGRFEKFDKRKEHIDEFNIDLEPQNKHEKDRRLKFKEK